MKKLALYCFLLFQTVQIGFSQQALLEKSDCKMLTAHLEDFELDVEKIDYVLEVKVNEFTWRKYNKKTSTLMNVVFYVPNEGEYRVSILPWVSSTTFAESTRFKKKGINTRSSNQNAFISNVYSHEALKNQCDPLNAFESYVEVKHSTLVIESQSLSEVVPISYILTDITGSAIHSGKFISKTELPINNMPRGIYMITLFTNDHVETTKFFK